MDVARSAPQGAHYHAGVNNFLPYLGKKKESSALWYSELSLHQLGSRPTVFIPRWTTQPTKVKSLNAKFDLCGE